MKLKIDNEALAEEFFEDSLLLGIVAPIKDYQFSWQLNQLLGLDFRVNNDIEIQLTKKQRKYFFSIYEYAVPAISLTHYLYNNEHDGEYLVARIQAPRFFVADKRRPGSGGRSESIDTIHQNLTRCTVG